MCVRYIAASASTKVNDEDMCVCVSLLQSQDNFMAAHHESMTRITDVHLRAGCG